MQLRCPQAKDRQEVKLIKRAMILVRIIVRRLKILFRAKAHVCENFVLNTVTENGITGLLGNIKAGQRCRCPSRTPYVPALKGHYPLNTVVEKPASCDKTTKTTLRSSRCSQP
jgi:hypothetical protein